MYAKSYNAETKKLSMITVQQFGEGGKLQQVENADTAVWNGQYWVMQNAGKVLFGNPLWRRLIINWIIWF